MILVCSNFRCRHVDGQARAREVSDADQGFLAKVANGSTDSEDKGYARTRAGTASNSFQEESATSAGQRSPSSVFETVSSVYYEVFFFAVQRYLTHEKQPPLQGHHRIVRIVLL